MNQQYIMYDHSSVTIIIILFVLIVLANEIGYRVGRFHQNLTDSEHKTLTNAIQASILGLLALLLGFTFSMSMARYDNRNHALIDEVNAIGTSLLRVNLLPDKYQNESHELFRKYVDLRVAIGEIDVTNYEERSAYNNRIGDIQSRLWSIAILAADEDPSPAKTGAFIRSLNSLIDYQGKRNALLHMQVPEVVMLLLFTVFISTGGMLGYSSGLSGNRVFIPSFLVAFLIALIVFIIIDLDRPKRGLIQVDQGLMRELQEYAYDDKNLTGEGVARQ